MTTTTAMRVFCQSKDRADHYDAEVDADITVNEVIEGLTEANYLPALAAGDQWLVFHARTNAKLAANARLDESAVKDGNQLTFVRKTNGA